MSGGKTGKRGAIALAIGTAVALVLYLLLQTLCAYLTLEGVLAEERPLVPVCCAALAAVLVGTLCARRRGGGDLRFGALLVPLGFLLLSALLGFLLFDGLQFGGGRWAVAVSALAGGLLGGLFQTAKRRKPGKISTGSQPKRGSRRPVRRKVRSG